MSSSIALNTPLTIADIIIRQDDNGRYCLNDLHKAAGNEKRHSPNYFLDTQQSKELITEIESTTGITVVEQNQAVVVINGGNKKGTYGVKDMVYAYAMWISPVFTLKVIRAYDALVTGQTPYGLKSLPEPPTATKAQIGILFNRVKTISGGSGKIRAELWSRFQNHFKLSSYKDLPADKFDDAMGYLDLKEQEYSQGVEMLWISRAELNDIVNQQLKALPAPDPLEGDVMPKPHHNSITLNLVPLETRNPKRWLITQACNEMVMMNALDDNVEVRTREQLIKALQQDNHVVAERTAHGVRSMVMDYLPIQVMPVILEAATTRMQRCNWQMPA